MRLYAETKRDFFLKEMDAQITFQTEGRRPATGLILHIWGLDVPAPRIAPAVREN